MTQTLQDWIIISISIFVLISVIFMGSWKLCLADLYYQYQEKKETRRKEMLRKMTNFSEDEFNKKCQVNLAELEANQPAGL